MPNAAASAGRDLKNPWFFCHLPKPNAIVRLFFFPYAGGGPHAFQAWTDQLPHTIECFTLHLPGRGWRIQEPMLKDLDLLLENIQRALLPLLDRPFVFFGHSFGGMLAYELTKKLQKNKYLLPSVVCISGCRAPDRPPTKRLSDLSTPNFFQQLVEMNGTPRELLENPSLMQLLEPTIRADIYLAENWQADCATKLATPLIALSGRADPIASCEHLLEWKAHTNNSFLHFEFPGDHFYLQAATPALCRLLAIVTMQIGRDENISKTKEIYQQVVSWNCTPTVYPETLTIPAAFKKQVKCAPNQIALISQKQTLTYALLDQKSDQVARYLVKNGVKAQEVVGVCLSRSVEAIVCFLAILKVGAAYLPLDPAYPLKRLQTMLDHAKAALLIQQQENAPFSCKDPYKLLILEKLQFELVEENYEFSCDLSNSDDIAYINYTSGSTGNPKAVAIPQRAVIRLLFNTNYIELNKKNITLQLAPLNFDAATFEIWAPLLHGGRCVLFDGRLQSLSALGQTLKQYEVNTLFLTTALFNTIIDVNPAILNPIQQLLTGGEAHSVAIMRKAYESLPHVKIISVYGPTEATTFSTYYPMTASLVNNNQSIPIGRPISHTEIYILDEQRRPVLPGVLGEIYIGGPGLARGYLYDDWATRQQFIHCLDFLAPHVRLFKTGDLGLYLADGNIEFHGRIDDQIKINGFRVELGEIEHTLREHPHILQAVALLDKQSDQQNRIVVFLLAKETKPSLQTIQTHLQQKLPAYMLPSLYHWVENFSFNENGKIDKKYLLSLITQTIGEKNVSEKSQ